MNTQETVIAKIRQLPEPQLKLVNGFLDVLLRVGEMHPVSHLSQSPATIKPKRTAGSTKGMIWMADDFNEPLEDFREYME